MTNAIPTTAREYDRTRIIERPDGFYWQSFDDGREHGPFVSLMEAAMDMEAVDDDNEGEAEQALREAEDVLGVPDWVDPETGQLADDEWTRTEDH